MFRKLGVALAVASVLALPFASANHGLVGRLAGALEDGSFVEAKLVYVSGNGNTQYFTFTFLTSGGTSFSCRGFGSIEVGFVSTTGCATAFRTGATGDAHAYPYAQADVHEVSISFGGVAGTAQQVFCADSGATAAACTTVVRTIPA